MDVLEQSHHETVKKPPPVPLKTYRWEDVRRSREKGGYPWTYLYKGPLDDSCLNFTELKSTRRTKSTGNVNRRHLSPKMDTSNAGSSTNVSQYLEPEVAAPSTSKVVAKRAKSEEPANARKRKHSLESAYSRVSKYSLSKKGIMKRLRQCKEKILGTKPPKSEVPKAVTKSEVKKSVPQKETIKGPLYIHIPLKPPPGEKDEFSYLEHEAPAVNGKVAKKDSEEESSVAETPLEEKAGVQLIFVTAPSDDEILDDNKSVPETPQSEPPVNGEIRNMEELKTLARKIADKYSPETKRKFEEAKNAKLEKEKNEEIQKASQKVNIDNIEEQKLPKEEEEVQDLEDPEKKLEQTTKGSSKKKKRRTKQSKLESEKTDDDKLEEQKLITEQEALKAKDKDTQDTSVTLTNVDEEDGLKTETVIAEIIEKEVDDLKDIDKVEEVTEVQIELEPSAASPSLLKKRVSFKRRSKESENGIYEVMEVTTTVSNEEKGDETQEKRDDNPMLDMAKTIAHEEIVRGMTVAEEYAYWCKINSAHEYEPINPPSSSTPTTPVATSKKIPDAPSDPSQTGKPSTPVTDSDIEFLAAKAADIELKTTGVITLNEPKDKARLVSLESALKFGTEKESHEEKEGQTGKKISEAIQKQASNLKRQASILSRKAGDQADKLQTRVKSIKRPKVKMPPKPKFEKPILPKLKIDKIKPKVSLNKVKNLSASMKLPKHSFTKRKSSLGEAEVSEKAPKKVFDFNTFPKMFSRKKRAAVIQDVETTKTTTSSSKSDLITMPKLGLGSKPQEVPIKQIIKTTKTTTKSIPGSNSSNQGSIRIPLHSEDSMDRDDLDLRSKEQIEMEEEIKLSNYDTNSLENNKDYIKENQEMQRTSSLNDRWKHGTFFAKNEPMVTDLDDESTKKTSDGKIDHASSIDDMRRRGVLEEINSDEFFLRQKGISQDNIEVGAYLSSEIREAFRTPKGLPPEAPRRKPIPKKTRRKKTPHVSQEGLQTDHESVQTEPEEYPRYYSEVAREQPERPIRRHKKSFRGLEDLEAQILTGDLDVNISKAASQEIRNLDENEKYFEDEIMIPSAPPRRNKSIRSLNYSERDSIMGEFEDDKEVQQELDRLQHEYQIPTPDIQAPKRPVRRSRTRSRSRGAKEQSNEALIGQEESLIGQEEALVGQEDEQEEIPCEEEPCRKVVCDYMGYSVIDKSQVRDPPLPPCRRRSIKSENGSFTDERNFATTPRSIKYNELQQETPVRPLRNYSTLGPSRPPRKSSVPNLTDEEKGITYHEYELEKESVHLQSGDVIQKMKDRPLPAPPRPPRKSRDSKARSQERLKESTNQPQLSVSEEELVQEILTDPLEQENGTSRVENVPRTSSPMKESAFTKESTPKKESIPKQESSPTKDYKPTVTEFEHQETVTHGTLLVQPFKHDETIPQGPVEMFSRSTERVLTVKKQVDDGTEPLTIVPDQFQNLRSPGEDHRIIERIIEKHIPIKMEFPNEVELLKASKLQVGDLDVDHLAVNELRASKIKVGDIEGLSINVNEINSQSGNLIVGGIELPPSFFQQLVEKLQEQVEQTAKSTTSIPTAMSEEARQTPSIPPLPATSSQPQGQAHGELSAQPSTETNLTQEELLTLSEEELLLRLRERAELTTDEEEPILGQKKTPIEVRLRDSVEEAPRLESRGDETPPPRPPQPSQVLVIDNQFWQQTDSDFGQPSSGRVFEVHRHTPIPMTPVRRRHHYPKHHHHHRKEHFEESSSEEEVEVVRRSRHKTRSPEPSIPQLSAQLTRACVNSVDNSVRRVLAQAIHFVLHCNLDKRQDMNVAVTILLVFIACIILLFWGSDGGNGKHVHHHHWEYFNPPRDI